MIGIGIITCQRPDRLMGCLAGVLAYTTGVYRLVVADDGGESVRWLRERGIETVIGPRRGVAWNRNRALYRLRDCDVVVLLDDDCWPAVPGWQEAWVAAARRWGYVDYAFEVSGLCVSGEGTPDQPFWCWSSGACCVALTRELLETVGYHDPRFVGYGYEDIEYRHRVRRAFGAEWPEGCVPCLRSGVRVQALGSFADDAEIERNRRLFHELLHEPIYRAPWRDDAERERFLRETDAERV